VVRHAAKTEKKVTALLNDTQKEVAAILAVTQGKVTAELENLKSELDSLLGDTASQAGNFFYKTDFSSNPKHAVSASLTRK
jgi:hypothetical protein